MKDPKNSLIENKYKLMTAEEISKRRIAAKAFEPLIKNKNISDIWDKKYNFGYSSVVIYP